VEVRVVSELGTVRLRVHDDGDAGARSNPGPGCGLIGMAGRARLLEGELRGGSDPERGRTATAVLPSQAQQPDR
jgi:signal transduction histidine kinase